MKHKPQAPESTHNAWFKCRLCSRTQSYAPLEEPHGVTIEEAEDIGWRWSEVGWLCPQHRNWEAPSWGLVVAFLATIAVSIAALAYRASALCWCWNVFVRSQLWPNAPHAQAWVVLGLLLLKKFVLDHQEASKEEDEEMQLSDKLRSQRSVVLTHVIGTSMFWGTIFLLVRIFG